MTVTHLRIQGRKTADGIVGIYGVIVRKAQLNLAPAIMVVQDLKSGTDLTFCKYLAEKGYITFAIDIAGKTEYSAAREVAGVDKPYTIYPESVSYANYVENEEQKAEIEGDARETCWYEWGRTIRYGVEFIKEQTLVTKTGVIGINDAATPLWQVLTADCGLSAAVIIGNIGWKGYRKVLKFGGESEPQFDDNALKYLAGIEPQAYAMHVKCPLAILSATNSAEYDIDRAYDTFSRISDKICGLIDYSVGGRQEIGYDCFLSAETFLNGILLKDKCDFPKEISVKGEIENGILKADVTLGEKGLKELTLYCAEEELDPTKRVWQRVTDVRGRQDGVFTFEYEPSKSSDAIMFFARAGYESGVHICSVVNCRKIERKEKTAGGGNVYYNSRTAEADSGFYPATENLSLPIGIDLDKNGGIKTKKGALDIVGLTCAKGILTYKPDIKKYKPTDGAIIMADVYMKNGGNLRIELVAESGGVKTTYAAQERIFVDLWQNVRVESNRFKTAEGKPLKSFESVIAMKLFADGEFLVNNLLWV